MRVFKRVYSTLIQRNYIPINKVPDAISLPILTYLPTFDYICNEKFLAFG